MSGINALLLDAAGTLLHPAEPVAATYARFGAEFGVRRTQSEIGRAMRQAMSEARSLREGDPTWRHFWRRVVQVSTGCRDPHLAHQLIDYFASGRAWRVADGARTCVEAVGRAGISVAIVSNWDTRLRGTLRETGVLSWLPLAVISGEEGVEKPAPEIFLRACSRLGVEPSRAIHVGDSIEHDVKGALAAGCAALHFGTEVHDFGGLERRLINAA